MREAASAAAAASGRQAPPSSLSLRELGRANAWSQTELATRSGVSLRTICNLETGRTTARVTTRKRLLRALRVEFRAHRSVFGPLGKHV